MSVARHTAYNFIGAVSGPLVSIVIPCFNRETLVGRAIESALAQGPNIEIIVIDDGSTDSSPTKIASYPNVRSVRISNSGPSAARNLGLELATGQFVRFLDSDDRLPTDAVKTLLEVVPQLADGQIAFGDAVIVDEHGTTKSTTGYGFSRAPAGVLSRADMLGQAMPSILPLFPVDVLRSIGGFDDSLRISEDQELAIRLLKQGFEFFHVPVVVYEAVDHAGERLSQSYGASGYRAQQQAFETIWRTLLAIDPPLDPIERKAVGRMVWMLGRSASRDLFRTEADKLFRLSNEISGSSGRHGPLLLMMMYRLVSAYRAERLLEATKAVGGRVVGKRS
jgi:glycosyltransferase involved in cell wall biosynthesis